MLRSLLAAGLAGPALLSTAAAASDPPYANLTHDCAQLNTISTPTGPHAVGRSDFFFVDAERPEVVTPDETDLRQVAMTVWYPARHEAGARAAEYMPGHAYYLAGFRSDAREIVRRIGESMAPLACARSNSQTDSEAAPGPTFPVIVFSPGGSMSRFWHAGLAETLSSQGYVVAVVGHAHSGSDLYPADGLHFNPLQWRPSPDATEEEIFALDEQLADMLAADVAFALDRLTDIQTGTLEHSLGGRLDLSGVTLAGHSRGGTTVSRACRTDDRFAQCITLDNIGNDHDVSLGLDRPQLTIRTEWEEERVATLHDYLGRNSTLAVDAVLPGSNHFTFSDLPVVLPAEYETDIDHAVATRQTATLMMRFIAIAQGEASADTLEGHVPGFDIERISE